MTTDQMAPILAILADAGAALAAKANGTYVAGHDWKHSSKSGACLVVWPDEGRWLCSSCKASGGLIDLLLDRGDAQTATQARERLIQRFGAEIFGARLPDIVINGRPLRHVQADAVSALEAANKPETLFVRKDELARVRTEKDGKPLIDAVTEPILIERLGQTANFLTVTRNKNTEEPKYSHAFPPKAVASAVIAHGEWPFPALEGIVEAPIMRMDGSILDAPGYDAATRLYYHPAPGLKVPIIPRKPTEADIARAVDTVAPVFADFPFVDEASRTNTWAALFTPIIRHLISGHIPLTLISATSAGTGKTLLTDCIAYIATGRETATSNYPKGDENELHKRLTAFLLDGGTFIMLDNVSGILDSPVLCQFVTSHEWNARLLGQHKNLNLPQKAVVVINGNNIELGGDIPRRCYAVKLDADAARPWERPASSFRIPDLEAFVRDNRGELLAAILTILRGWFVAGRPNAPEGKGLGSFEAWRRVLGGVIHFIGIPDFLGNLDSMYEAMDVDGPAWAAHFAAWHDTLGERAYTVQEIIESFKGDPDFKDTVPEPYLTEINDLLGGRKNTFSRKYGWMLRKKNGVVFPNQLRLEKAPELSREQNAQWRVIARESAGSSKNEPASQWPGNPASSGEFAGSFPYPPAGDFSGNSPVGPGLKINQHEPASPENAAPEIPAYITDPDDARRLIKRLIETELTLGFDTETTGLDPHADRLRLVTVATATHSWTVDVARVPVDLLRPVLEGGPLKIAHNAKFDWQFLRAAGIAVAPIYDTLLADQVIHARSYGRKLSDLAADYLGRTVDKGQQTSDWSAETLTPAQIEYALTDAAILVPLAEKLAAEIEAAGLTDAVSLENRALPAIAWLEFNGVAFNHDEWAALANDAAEKAAAIRARLDALAADAPAQQGQLFGGKPVNWDSPADVKKGLDALGIPVSNTNEETLQAVKGQHPVIPLLLEYRGSNQTGRNLRSRLATAHQPEHRADSRGLEADWSGKRAHGLPAAQPAKPAPRPALPGLFRGYSGPRVGEGRLFPD